LTGYRQLVLVVAVDLFSVEIQEAAGIYWPEAHRELLEHIFSQKRRIHGEIRPFVESAIREKIQRDREKEAKEKIKRKPPK